MSRSPAIEGDPAGRPGAAAGSRRDGSEPRGIPPLFLLGLLLVAVPAANDVGAPAEETVVSTLSCHRTETERFVFHHDPWINLHHFLFQWARSEATLPGDRRESVEVPERGDIGGLDPAERTAWEQAVGFYRERLVQGDPLFDRNLIELRESLKSIACSEAGGGKGIDPEAWTVLEAAMPVYRRHWWPAHRAANQAWIASLAEELDRYEAPLAARLAHAYGGRWPEDRLRVDVSAYANSTRAYTTNDPDVITLTSTDPHKSGLNALEMVFHEASHATFFEDRLVEQLDEAFARHSAEAPRFLFHLIQFLTPPELVRSVVEEEKREGFIPYDQRADVFQGSRWTRLREATEIPWRAFLAGEIERSEALDRIAAALVEP